MRKELNGHLGNKLAWTRPLITLDSMISMNGVIERLFFVQHVIIGFCNKIGIYSKLFINISFCAAEKENQKIPIELNRIFNNIRDKNIQKSISFRKNILYWVSFRRFRSNGKLFKNDTSIKPYFIFLPPVPDMFWWKKLKNPFSRAISFVEFSCSLWLEIF